MSGSLELAAVLVTPIATLAAVWMTQRSGERAAAKREEGETARLHEQLRNERAVRQMDQLREKRRADAVALLGWLIRSQARLDVDYLEVTQIHEQNPKVSEHISALLELRPENPAEMGLDAVLIPISSAELRHAVRAVDRWSRGIQALLPPVKEWLSQHPGPWNAQTGTEWWEVCRPYLDASEDRDDRFAELAGLMEAYELGIDLD